MFGISREEVAQMREEYVGKEVEVVINDFYHYFKGTGIVDHVDDAGHIHGVWYDKDGKICTLAVIPGEDSIHII